MRLKIEITGGSLGNARKDRSRYEPAVIQFWFARLGVIQDDNSDKLRMLGWQVTAKGHDVFAFFVSTPWIAFLGRSGFTGNGKAGNGRGGRSTAIAYHAAQCVADLSSCLRRDYLAQYHWRQRADRFAVRSRNRFYDARSD